AMPERARDFGIAPRNIFEFDEWVGGRYSVWSAVGLPVALCLGTEAFDALLAGGHAMDRHFLTAPFGENLPMLAGLLGIWNINFLGYDNLAVIPYRQSLELLPSYLQQLEMESNGKSVRRDGQPVDYATAPVLWGQVGTNAQHAFFQLLHQGTVPGAVDFILPLPERDRFPGAADQLVANCLAQWEALAMGRTDSDTRDRWDAHRRFPGNRPSSLLALDRLDARGLGALLALYEHKVLVQSCVWDINPFDQMGVELGKRLAGRILRAMAGGRERLDPATRGFLDDFPHAT
ncbi:MAG: glucose-6-phosphate isomerase, partial [Gammaproteobacteria bacterium]